MPNISIIIPVYGDWTTLEQCIESLIKYVKSSNTVILVNDDGPQADELEANIVAKIKAYPNFHYFRN